MSAAEPHHDPSPSDQRRLAELNAVLENAVDAIITINQRGLIESVNPATIRMFGFGQDELIGNNIKMLMPEPYQHQHDGYLDHYARTRQRKIIGIGREVLGKRKDGTVFPIDLAVSESNAAGRLFYTGMIRDLSDRHRIESELRVGARVLAAARQGVCVIDTRQSHCPIESSNPALSQITGHDADWLVGKSIHDIFDISETTGESSLAKIGVAMQQGEAATSLFRCRHKDGHDYWPQIDASPVHDDDAAVTHYVVLVTDVTDQQERQAWLEREVRERTRDLEMAQAKLVQQERLAVLGRISGSIAHEIRNPLNAIKTSAYYLIHARKTSEVKTLEHLERIDRQVTMINNVVSVLSEGARMPLPVTDPTSIPTLVHEALETVEIHRIIEVQQDLPDDLHPVWVDGNQIAIVLRNLFRNARDAMRDGGLLHISAKNMANEHGEVDRVIVSVRDTGTGIADEIMPNIHEPLFTTKSHGMGLGLSISYAIIENNRGNIVVESKVDEGTTFHLHLPTQAATAANTPAQEFEDPGFADPEFGDQES